MFFELTIFNIFGYNSADAQYNEGGGAFVYFGYIIRLMPSIMRGPMVHVFVYSIKPV